MRLVACAIALVIAAVAIACHALGGTWAWQLPAVLGLMASAALIIWVADESASAARYEQERLENARQRGMMLTDDEIAVIEAMRRDDRKARR
jgi:membrane protein implicated in regulation of membrane protease activity